MQTKQIKITFERKYMYINNQFFMHIESVIKVPKKSEFILYGNGKTFLIDKDTLANNLFSWAFDIEREGQKLSIKFHT